MPLSGGIYTEALVALAGVFCVLLYARRCKRTESELQEELRSQKESFERQVEKAREAVKAKSDFLSKMSHEIRTPLNAIIGMAQIARNASTLQRAKECIDKVEESSKHLLGVINDILDFSKIETGGLVLEERFFSLRDDIDFVISMLKIKANEKNVELRSKIGEIQHDGLKTDMLRLNQVLINLLSNAIKFTGSGGLVSLEVKELADVGGESAYRFIVQDNGIGIDPTQAKKLFTPFTQANEGISRVYGGTGLGLVISQNIVRMMGGDIELETEPGKGSSFSFTIRVSARESADVQRDDKAEAVLPRRFPGKRVLIVDDIELNREVVSGMLENSGVDMEMAANGREAVDAYMLAESGRFDMILMDMQMPIMDGCAATKEIRASGRPDAETVRIVAMTANVMKEDVDRAYESGMDAYIAKPIDMDTLYHVMGEWL